MQDAYRLLGTSYSLHLRYHSSLIMLRNRSTALYQLIPILQFGCGISATSVFGTISAAALDYKGLLQSRIDENMKILGIIS